VNEPVTGNGTDVLLEQILESLRGAAAAPLPQLLDADYAAAYAGVSRSG
jgi:hypothetical protein